MTDRWTGPSLYFIQHAVSQQGRDSSVGTVLVHTEWSADQIPVGPDLPHPSVGPTGIGSLSWGKAARAWH
jgi:hypothetical protein